VDVANKGYSDLWDLHLQLQTQEESMAGLLPKISAQMDVLRSKRDQIIADKDAKEKAERDAKIAKEKAERERIERERKERAERENQAKDEKRLADLKTDVKDKYLSLNQFDLAVNEIERVRNEFKIPEYKDRVKSVLERYTRLRQMKQDIITGLGTVVPNTGPVVNGEAITAVTPTQITLRNSGAIAFERMKPNVFLQLIGFSVRLAQNSKEKQAEFFLAAAIYKYELGEQDENFDVFLEQAIKRNPKLVEELGDLLPGATIPAP
jgi:hypothetical protein